MTDRHVTPELDAATALEPQEWHIRDLLSVVYRRRWVALSTFFVVATGVALYTLSTTPVYQAQAQLLVAERPSVVTFQGDQQNNENGLLETQQRLLQSRALARRVIDELDLWANNVTPAPPEGSDGPLDRLRRWRKKIDSINLGRLSGNSAPVSGTTSHAGANGSEAQETTAESRSIDQLLSRLYIAPIRNTRIIEVKYESTDPVLAARVVNTLTSTYIDRNLEVRSRVSTEASTWLADQLAEQRRKVEDSELALQKYREQKDSLSLEAGQNIVVQRLTALNAAATQAKTDRIAIEAAYRQLSARESDREALDAFPVIRSNNQVQQIRGHLANLERDLAQLSKSLGAKHPDMVRLNASIEVAERDLATEIANAVESLRQDYLAALSREKELTAALESQKTKALALNRQSIDYGVLLREAESNRQIYQSLLQRANETAVSSRLRNSNIEVVDAAEVPRAPIRPNIASNLLLGLLLGCMLAVGLPVTLEATNSHIQTPTDIKHVLRLPFLGMLPHVSRRTLKGKAPLLGAKLPAVYTEACRSLRTNILASNGAKSSRSLLVTSASPRDGKSIVAVNLALAISRSGHRVLLIDADMRCPVQHTLLGRKQGPGLSEVLAGRQSLSKAIVATRYAGVSLLASGSCPSNPSELLGSRRFAQLLDNVSQYFDWVIIDSPPAMAVTDPAVIARVVSGVLFVVNARRTKQRVAQAALDRLETAGASFAGVVLNGVRLDRDHYYNAHYYLPSHSEYFSQSRTA
jgi:capsular exopolysaccharide synthesis family protein